MQRFIKKNQNFVAIMKRIIYNLISLHKESVLMNNTKEYKDIIKTLRKARENQKLSYQQLADITGISKSTLQRYETGHIKNIKFDNLVNIAIALGIPAEELFYWNRSYPIKETIYVAEDSETYEDNYFSSDIQVYGKICAGNGKLAYEDIIDEIICPYPRVEGHLIGLQVDGESMNKVVPNGVYAIIKRQPAVENGQICAVIIDNEDAMLKRFYRLGDDTVILKPESTEDFRPITYVGEEINKLKIIGKYIGHVSPCLD